MRFLVTLLTLLTLTGPAHALDLRPGGVTMNVAGTCITLTPSTGVGAVTVATCQDLSTTGTPTFGDVIVGSASTRGQGDFVMSAFRTADQKLYVLASSDGLTWRFLSTLPVFTPAAGSVRDPSILYANNVWYVAYTTNAFTDQNSFTILSSPDLITWTALTTVTVLPSAVSKRVWSPEWFVDTDGTVNVFVVGGDDGGGSTITNAQIYVVTASNAALTTWGAATALTGSGFPSNMIDPFVAKLGSTYHLFYKKETNVPATAFIEHATSSGKGGSYTVVGTGDWAGWGTPFEGPSLVQIDSTRWRIYLDKYTAQGMYYSESTDSFATWTAPVLVTSPPFTVSHPTISRQRSESAFRNLAAGQAQQSPAFVTDSSGNLYTLGLFGIGVAPSGAALHVLPTSGTFAKWVGDNSLSQFMRTLNTKYNGLNWETNLVDDWFVGERETTDSDFHFYSYGISADALVLKRASGEVNAPKYLAVGTSPATPLNGAVHSAGVTFANLGTPSNGALIFCTDCDPPTLVDSTCTSAGAKTGSLAFRVNGAWKCIS